MNTLVKNLAVGMFCAAAVSACGGSSSSTYVASGPWGAVDSTLNGFLSSSAGPDRVTGYAFMVVGPNGQLHVTAGGKDPVISGRAFTASTVQPIASASKLPAALAILTLVQAGTINLDTPISTYLAGSAVTWPGDKAAITMRMLLNHTSGLPGLDHQTDAGFPACVNENNPDAPTAYTMAQCAQDVANTSLVNTPGQVFDYGGADFQVAGYVAMVVSGSSTWQGFFNSAFANPMGLNTNVLTYGDPATVTNPRVGGGITTDVGNYALILQMLLNHGVAANGHTMFDSTTLANFRVNQIATQLTGGGLATFYPPNLSPAADYAGYSFGLFFTTNASLYSPSLGPEFSDPGSYGTTAWIDLDSGPSATLGPAAYAAILLINEGPSSPAGIDIWNAVRGDVQTAVTSG